MDLQKNEIGKIVGSNLFKSFNTTQVLIDCNFSIRLGEITTIVGRSGCGKTTLLKCINGIETIDSGQLSIETQKGSIPSTAKKYQSNFGLVLQGGFLWRRKTILENIITAPLLLNHSKSETNEKAISLLKKFGIVNKKNQYPENLSGGEQQRAAVARALIMEPKILLLDEITFSLDPFNKLDVLDTILKIKSDGYTIVLVSHDISFSKKVSDNILYMDNGKILETIPKAEFENSNGFGHEFLNLGV